MSRRTVRMAIAAVVAITAALVVWNQIEVYFDRQARAALVLQRHPPVLPSPEVLRQRQALFAMLQPVGSPSVSSSASASPTTAAT